MAARVVPIQLQERPHRDLPHRTLKLVTLLAHQSFASWSAAVAQDTEAQKAAAARRVWVSVIVGVCGGVAVSAVGFRNENLKAPVRQ